MTPYESRTVIFSYKMDAILFKGDTLSVTLWNNEENDLAYHKIILAVEQNLPAKVIENYNWIVGMFYSAHQMQEKHSRLLKFIMKSQFLSQESLINAFVDAFMN